MPDNEKLNQNNPPKRETTQGSGKANRRSLLKGIAVTSGAVAVSRWKTPVVKQVILPAHAVATGYTCDIRLFTSEDISDSFAIAAVSPPPPYPPGALIRCELVFETDQDTRIATAEGRTDANGEIIVRETDFSPDPSTLIPSGVIVETVTLRKSCVNPEECDAECELDVTDLG